MGAVILIGMPASGKSTVGVLLAKTLGKGFIDTDLIIQQQQGRLLQEIIDENGLDHFLMCEEQAALSVVAGDNIIATGGSMVMSAKAMEHLKSIGTFVYIQTSFDEIRRRLRNIKTRGIAMGKSQTLEQVYNLRCPLYEQYADLIIPTSVSTIEETVQRVLQKLN